MGVASETSTRLKLRDAQYSSASLSPSAALDVAFDTADVARSLVCGSPLPPLFLHRCARFHELWVADAASLERRTDSGVAVHVVPWNAPRAVLSASLDEPRMSALTDVLPADLGGVVLQLMDDSAGAAPLHTAVVGYTVGGGCGGFAVAAWPPVDAAASATLPSLLGVDGCVRWPFAPTDPSRVAGAAVAAATTAGAAAGAAASAGGGGGGAGAATRAPSDDPDRVRAVLTVVGSGTVRTVPLRSVAQRIASGTIVVSKSSAPALSPSYRGASAFGAGGSSFTFETTTPEQYAQAVVDALSRAGGADRRLHVLATVLNVVAAVADDQRIDIFGLRFSDVAQTLRENTAVLCDETGVRTVQLTVSCSLHACMLTCRVVHACMLRFHRRRFRCLLRW